MVQTVLKTSIIEYNPHSQKNSVDLGQGSPWELKFSDGLSEILGLAIGNWGIQEIGAFRSEMKFHHCLSFSKWYIQSGIIFDFRQPALRSTSQDRYRSQ